MPADTVELVKGPWLLDEHDHEWTEKLVRAIWRQCSGCGKGELIHDRRVIQSVRRQTNPKRLAEYAAWKEAYEGNPEATVATVAVQFGVKYGQMLYGLRRVHTTMHARGRQKANPAQIERGEQWVRRYRAGDTLEQIGRDYGVSRERVRQILVKQGLDTKAVVAERAAQREANRPTDRACRFGCGGRIPNGDRQAWIDHRHEKHPWITPEAAAKYHAMVADYDAGMKQNEITAKYACAPTLIYRALRYVGRSASKRPSTSRLPKTEQSRARQLLIVDDLRGTGTTAEIAAKHHVSAALVWQVNRRFDIRQMESHIITPEIEAEMRTLREQGMGPRAIGRKFGFNENTVARHLRGK